MKHLGPVARTVLDLGGFMAKQQEGKFWKICYSNKLQGTFTFTPCLFLQMFKFVYACISWEDLRWHPWLHFCGFNLCNWLWRTGLVQKGLGLSVSCDWIKGEWGWNGRSCKSVAVNHVWTKCAHAPLHKWTGEGERANICISHAGVWGGCEGGHWSSWSRLEPRRWCWWKGRNYCGAWEGMRRHLLPQCLLEFMIRILTAGDFGRWLSRTEATRFRWNLRCCWMKGEEDVELKGGLVKLWDFKSGGDAWSSWLVWRRRVSGTGGGRWCEDTNVNPLHNFMSFHFITTAPSHLPVQCFFPSSFTLLRSFHSRKVTRVSTVTSRAQKGGISTTWWHHHHHELMIAIWGHVFKHIARRKAVHLQQF